MVRAPTSMQYGAAIAVTRAEGEAGGQIRRGDIQPGVRFEYLHDRVTFDAERLDDQFQGMDCRDRARAPKISL